jgi:putative NIF3 family GTP cyclohydrolase 1 type 2
MNTDDIMRIALDMAGMKSIPADSAIYHPATDIRRILLGIDMDEKDLRFAKSNGYDLVLAHHPLDRTRFVRVMKRHESLMVENGVAPSLAMKAWMEHQEVYEKWAESVLPDRTAQHLSGLSRELGIGLMNVHMPCDEIGRRILQKYADSLSPYGFVADLMKAYRSIPELAALREEVELACGSSDARLGRAAVIHGAGTNGGYPVANALFESGVGTVVYIHLSRPHRIHLAEESKGNLILTGHYGSDSLGINPLVDALENRGIHVDCRNNMIRTERHPSNQATGIAD